MINTKNKSRSDNPPIQTPHMFQPKSEEGRQFIFGYSKSIRNCDKAILDLFSDIIIIYENTAYPVPIIWGSQEKAAAYVFGENFINNPNRKEEGLVDRITLPIIALTEGNIEQDQSRHIYHEARNWRPLKGCSGLFNQEKKEYDTRFGFSKGIPINRSYTLHIWAKYVENLHQIIEQIHLKFAPIAYILVDGISWETPVKNVGSTSNITEDIGDRQTRILKYQFELVAETHISQPIKRTKTALKIIQKHVILGDLATGGDDIFETTIVETKKNDTPETIKKERENQ